MGKKFHELPLHVKSDFDKQYIQLSAIKFRLPSFLKPLLCKIA